MKNKTLYRHLALLFALFLSLPALAQEFDDAASGLRFRALTWEEGNMTCEVIRKDGGYSGAITVPATATGTILYWNGYDTEVISGTFTVKRINWWAFSDCSELTSVTISEGIEEICEYAFANAGDNFTSITLPNSLKSIGERAFSNCQHLSGITFTPNVEEIGIYAFQECHGLTSLTIPGNIKTIGEGAFCNCSNLSTLTLGNGIETIGKYAFDNCHSLTTVNIPSSIVSVGSMAFHQCTGLSSFTGPHVVGGRFLVVNGSLVSYIRLNEQETTLTIPDGVTKICEGVFVDNHDVEKIVIPTSVTAIEDNAIQNCSMLKEFDSSLASADKRCLIVDGRLVAFARYDESENTSYTIPSNVTAIGKSVFSGYWKYNTIILPDGLISIDDNSFASCFSLTSITLPNSVTTIGERAFCDMPNLTSVNLGTGITSMGYCNFANCPQLSSFSGSVVSADGRCIVVGGILVAFASKDAPTTYTIPENVKEIGDQAFYNIPFEELNFPDNVETISNNAFAWWDYTGTSDSSPLTTLTFGKNVKLIKGEAFINSKNISSITISTKVPPSLDGNAFSDEVKANCSVKVPYLAVEAYRMNWEFFGEGGSNITAMSNEATIDHETEYWFQTEMEIPSLNYSREFANGEWQALYLPFGMTYNEWKDWADIAEVNNVHQYFNEDGTLDKTVLEFRTIKGTGKTINPYTPYVIRSKAGATTVNIPLSDKTLVTTGEARREITFSSAHYFYRLEGTTSLMEDVEGKYYISSKGGSFVRGTSSSKLKPNRIFLSIEARDGGYGLDTETPAAAPRVSILVDGETTGIEGLVQSAERGVQSAEFNLQGQKVDGGYKGIVIVNGKKVLRK